jgi:hypothetical protein
VKPLLSAQYLRTLASIAVVAFRIGHDSEHLGGHQRECSNAGADVWSLCR